MSPVSSNIFVVTISETRERVKIVSNVIFNKFLQIFNSNTFPDMALKIEIDNNP